MSLTLTAHGNLVTPDVLGIFGDEIGDLGSDVTGGDGVGAGVADPLDGERLACMTLSAAFMKLCSRARTEVDDTGLGGVVGCLHLGKVDNMTAHGGGSHETTVCEVGELVAIPISAFLLLAAPVGSGGLGAVEGTVEVDADHIAVVLESTIDHGSLSPRNTCVGNEDVETAVEVLDNVIDSLLDSLVVGDIDLVGLGCSSISQSQEERFAGYRMLNYAL